MSHKNEKSQRPTNGQFAGNFIFLTGYKRSSETLREGTLKNIRA